MIASAEQIPPFFSIPSAWLADESPLNDLDEAEGENDDQPLPEEVLENLTEEADPPAAIPDPGPM
ncbi:hypothetical protein [Pseudomonas sp.]|jgi:hypothetical protein|uniref:hypothetical protein n=1 Tax=Pseudomonas sp. TaxID=306 RepID=UPI0028A65766|nr:hypothetical protein [Pseudomonas sp.]